LLYSLFAGEIGEIFVIVILFEDVYVRLGEDFDYAAGDGSFAGACAAADADD
jgi:hypothetical protein